MYLYAMCWTSIDHCYASDGCIRNSNNTKWWVIMMRCDYLPMLLFISAHVLSECIPVNFHISEPPIRTHEMNSTAVIATLAILSSILFVSTTFFCINYTTHRIHSNLKAYTHTHIQNRTKTKEWEWLMSFCVDVELIRLHKICFHENGQRVWV